MKPSELFGVVVRTLGFLIILYSFYDFLSSFDAFFENVLSRGQDSESGSVSVISYFVFGIPEFIAGVLLFFFADWFVRLAYRDSSS